MKNGHYYERNKNTFFYYFPEWKGPAYKMAFASDEDANDMAKLLSKATTDEIWAIFVGWDRCLHFSKQVLKLREA